MSIAQRRIVAFSAIFPSLIVLMINLPNLLAHRAELVAALPEVLRGAALLAALVAGIAVAAGASAFAWTFFRDRVKAR